MKSPFIDKNLLVSKGSLITFSDELEVLNPGVNGQVLVSDSTQPAGLKWSDSGISGLTANRALISDSNGKVSFSTVTSTELGYVSGVTSSIQTQLNGKSSTSHTHPYLPLSGGTITGDIRRDIPGGTANALIWGYMADNDFYRIVVGGSSNAGYLEIATADDGNEPIYVRQYTGQFTTVARTATLLDGNGNTVFPGTVYSNGSIALLRSDASCNKSWNWSGQGGQPPWLWGGSDGTNMYVYNPSNFSVNYANSAGSAGSASSAGYADQANRAIDPVFNGANCNNVGGTDILADFYTGFYMGVGMPNAPTGDWYYFLVLRHNADWSLRVAFPLNVAGIPKWRKKSGGAWGSWYNLTS